MFQSLFYWTSELNVYIKEADEVFLKFQSLFYWTQELNTMTVSFPSYLVECFNPCFIGLRN